MDIDPHAVKTGFDALKSAIETFKKLAELFRGDPKKLAEATDAMAAAEREVAFAEAQLSQALGYKLCRAHFPPKPMLLDRVEPKYIEEIHKCGVCGREDPPAEHFAFKRQLDAGTEEHNRSMEQYSNWLTR